MLNNGKRKAQFIVFTAFLLGLLSGGLVTYILQNRQATQASTVTTILNEVDQRVSLRTEQRTEVDAILQDTRQQYKTLKEQTRPQYETIRQAAREKIRRLLDQQQQARFEQYVQELDAKRAAARQAEENKK